MQDKRFNYIDVFILLLSYVLPKYFCFFYLIVFRKENSDFFREVFLVLFFILNVSLWAYFYEKVSALIFLYSLLLITFIYCSLKFFSFYGDFLRNSWYSLWLVLLHLWFYKIGGLIFFGGNYVFPIYYQFFQFGIYSNFFGDWFFKNTPFIFLFMHTIISYFFIKNRKIIIFILIFIQSFFVYIDFALKKQDEIEFIEKIKCIFPCQFGVFENKIKSENYCVKNNSVFVFPESSVEVFDYSDIEKIKNFAIENRCELFLGLVHKKNKSNSFCEKHGVLKVEKDGKIYWREKNYVFPFIERKAFFKKNNESEIFNFKENIFICSEILLHEFCFYENLKKSKPIFLISDRWTNTIFTFWFKNIIKCCMNIHKNLI